MSVSPLQFAQEFEKFKSELSKIPAEDIQILRLMDFWPNLKEKVTDRSYQSYFEEYHAYLVSLLNHDNLNDLTIDELKQLAEAIIDIQHFQSDDEFIESLNFVYTKLASLYFYVGDIDEGLKLCGTIIGDESLSIPDIISASQDAYSAFNTVYDYFKDSHPQFFRLLSQIHDEWESVRDAYYYDRVYCLFVEKTDHGRSLRGRMRLLKGSVEYFDKNATTDEITFDNQIKTPDDPFVGASYDALKAVRGIFKNLNYKTESTSFYHAHFAIHESGQTFTGDSIGLATGLLAYTQLMRPDISRVDRFLSAEIACTGGIEESGQITKVNDESLKYKIERAFFSPVKYLVLPKDNQTEADNYLKQLQKRYPKRNLIIIGLYKFSDAIENRNILRDEKVCIGEFVTKKAIKYSRAAKIQVPILLALLYALICIIYPKAWIGFDWNPQYVQPTETGFIALNADSVPLWSVEFDSESLTNSSKWKIGDLDDDGKNEVAFIPTTLPVCDINANLFLYDDDKDLIFQDTCVILNEYIGDTTLQQPYFPGDIDFISKEESPIIISRIKKSFPARLHLKFWNMNGDPLGWYINAGFSGASGKCFANVQDEGLFFLSYNNRMDCACLFVLDPDSSYGTSPPYGMNNKKGKQKCYILFPRTDLNKVNLCKYNYPGKLVVESDSLFMVEIGEMNNLSSRIRYYFNKDFRVFDVKAEDPFINARDKAVRESKLDPIEWQTYLEDLRDGVTYWIDSDWVTEGELRAAEK
ncbi:MAG: hypothetical protein V3V99_06975 [candidate division Zixibacteria bacterium]